VDSERAERHLRLAAEAGLRRALMLPRYDAELRSRDVFTDSIARVHGVAAALIAAGAIDAHRAEAITLQFQAALAVRHRLHPHAAGPLLGPPHRWRPGPHAPAASAAPGVPGAPEAPGARPARVIPVGRMLPFRDEDVAGELYVLSLVITEHQAVAPVVARIRHSVHGGGWLPAAHGYVPVSLTAADDQGTTYIAGLEGGGDLHQWEGRVRFLPPPPPGASWLRLGTGPDDNGFRIDLTAKPATAGAVVTPVSADPGEWLLDNMVRDIVARAVEGTVTVQRRSGGPGDVIAALEAAGVLSPFSPTPGRIATIYERIGITRHGITARPAADLPEPWLSALAYFGRRHRPPVQDGTATVAVVLPEMDGAQLALAGLHTRADQTFLHIVARGLPDIAPFGSGQAALLDSGGWLRDDAGQWHVAVSRKRRETGDEASVVWRVLPPLGRETAAFTLVRTAPGSRATVQVPLSWWASP
jgi:hypothetical protein